MIYFSHNRAPKGYKFLRQKGSYCGIARVKKQNKPCLLLGEVAIGTWDMCLGGYQLGK